MKDETVVDSLAASLVNRYHQERGKGIAHQAAWEKSVGALMLKLDDMDMLVQMEAASILGKTHDLKTGEPLGGEA